MPPKPVCFGGQVYKDEASFDMFMNYIGPLVQLICFIEFIVLIIFRIVNIQLYDIFSSMYSYGIFFLVVTYISGVIISIFVVQYNKRKSRDVISSIALFAVFILSWIPINIMCVFKKDMKWEAIKHNRSINASDMNISK